MIRRQRIVNDLIQVLNFVAPFAEGAGATAETLIYHNQARHSKWLSIVMTVSTYMVGILNLFFGACLFFAVHQISKYVDKLGSGINKKALILHAASFGLYMLSIVVADGFYANY